MKKINLIMLLCLGSLASCLKDTTGDVSRVTNYPVFQLKEGNTNLILAGTRFTDPGAASTIEGKEVENTTSYSKGVYRGFPGVDTSKPDLYKVTYSAKNSDGYSRSATRDVWVASTGDLTTSIEGLYTASVQRAPKFQSAKQYNGLKYVFIWKTGGNTYEISDALGGYYNIARGYGTQYAARRAAITANNIATNSFTITQATIPGWNLKITLSQLEVNAASKTITFTGAGTFANGTFKVQLKQIKI